MPPHPSLFARAAAALLRLAVCVLPCRAATPPEPLPGQAAAALPSAADRLKELREKFGPTFHYEVDDKLKLIFAAGADRASLRAVRLRLADHAGALKRELFPTGMSDYVTVALPREWKGSAQGFYNPHERSIISRSTGIQLIHEFTHALHWDDMRARAQFHQNWVIEGIATMCESSGIIEGRLVPRPNHRLKIIKRLVKGDDHVPWGTYVGWTQKQFMKAPGNHYAQAQSMLTYLHATGNLRKWYDAYVAGFAADPTGAAAFESVFSKTLAEIEKEWAAWVRDQPLPADPPAAAPSTPIVPPATTP
jgi:hypothetical protein